MEATSSFCCSCRLDLLSSSFGPDKQRKSGLRRVCNPCRAAWARRSRAALKLPNQPTVCEICDQPCSTGRALAVDHSHDTDEIRGRLCSTCNQGLGLLKDAPYTLARSLRYLATHGKALSTEELLSILHDNA